jgi:chromosome segregation ATPase
MSRLQFDDITLGSTMKSGSVFSSMTNADKWKEPLEAAIKECQRVRDRSAKLKEQIEAQKSIIERLEQENGRLSLNASRRNEEINLVERALLEAKDEIGELRESLESRNQENENLAQRLEDANKERRFIQEGNERLTKELVTIKEQKEYLRVQLEDKESKLAAINEEFEALGCISEEHKRRIDELVVQLATKEFEVTEKKELELTEVRRSLQKTERELTEIQRSREDALRKLSLEVEAKLKLEAVVSELQNAQKQLLSDVEDRDLESQYACEDMRKERAELRSQLKEAEKEAADLKEAFAIFKGKVQVQVDEKRATIEKLQSQQNKLLSNIDQVMPVRAEFFDLLKNLGLCDQLDSLLQSIEGDNDAACDTSDHFVKGMNEIDIWKVTFPQVGEELLSLHHTVTKLPDLESQFDQLADELSKYELREADHLKQLCDERAQNDKLFMLLRQAEQEMERSTTQIREMSEAMERAQEREHEANERAKSRESEVAILKEDFEKLRVEKKEELEKLKRALSENAMKLEEKDSLLLENNSVIDSMKHQLEDASYQLRSKEAEERSLKSTIQSLEQKTARLRDYVRKLTTKCEEWEESYEKQSRAIEKLQEKNARIRDKATDIADRYRKLAGEVQRKKRMYHEDRARWSNERSSLNHVHMALEKELEQITKELSLPFESVDN